MFSVCSAHRILNLFPLKIGLCKINDDDANENHQQAHNEAEKWSGSIDPGEKRKFDADQAKNECEEACAGQQKSNQSEPALVVIHIKRILVDGTLYCGQWFIGI